MIPSTARIIGSLAIPLKIVSFSRIGILAYAYCLTCFLTSPYRLDYCSFPHYLTGATAKSFNLTNMGIIKNFQVNRVKSSTKNIIDFEPDKEG